VESAEDPSVTGTLPPVTIAAYHAGRCLDFAGTRIQQDACGRAARWSLRGGPDAWELQESGGRCLDPDEAGPAVRACTGAQRWQVVRTGNTFSLRSASGLCLEVSGQSRAAGAPLALAPCTGAAHQQWEIESLRAADHERLYQADRDRIAWLPAPDADHPLPVTTEGTRAVCRSRDPVPWPGVVSGELCAGRRYDGTAVTTAAFDRLVQAR
jgi:hypothetical protein